MKCKINHSVSAALMAPFGAPEGWQMAAVCIENDTHNLGALICHKTTGVFRLLCGHSVFSVDQNFAKKVWCES